MDGILVIDKPVGPTSHDVVAEVKRLLRARKVGHLGTLDPAASGVLPLVINAATKQAQHLAGTEKVYEFTFCAGITTETDDETGRELSRTLAPMSLEPELQALLPRFTGRVLQRPPRFSAVKVGGRRAYALARKGQEPAIEPRPVQIDALEVVGGSWPELRLRLCCRSGTYVRSLCRDLGEALGVGGHARGIRRLQSGPYIIDRAVGLSALRSDPGLASSYLIPV